MACRCHPKISVAVRGWLISVLTFDAFETSLLSNQTLTIMIYPLIRLSARSATQNLLKAGRRHQRRCISFAPPSKKPRSLKNKLARLGLAGGAVYWFANSDIQLFSKQDDHEHGCTPPIPKTIMSSRTLTNAYRYRNRDLRCPRSSQTAHSGNISRLPKT